MNTVTLDLEVYDKLRADAEKWRQFNVGAAAPAVPVPAVAIPPDPEPASIKVPDEFGDTLDPVITEKLLRGQRTQSENLSAAEADTLVEFMGRMLPATFGRREFAIEDVVEAANLAGIVMRPGVAVFVTRLLTEAKPAILAVAKQAPLRFVCVKG